MRLTTLLRRLLGVTQMYVKQVEMAADGPLTVSVEPSWRRSRCGTCGKRAPRYDRQPVREWRHLSWGRMPAWLRYAPWRVSCRRCSGVKVEQVPWASGSSVFTSGFEELAAYLAQVTDRTAVSRLLGISWVTVGSIVERVVARRLDGARFAKLRRIGVDEFSYRKRHRYLTIVVDHDERRVVWAGRGRSAETLGAFFEQLGPGGCARIELVTADLASSWQKALRAWVPHARVVFDRFHVERLAADAVDEVRRSEQRRLASEPEDAKALKGTRYALLKHPARLRPGEARRLETLRRKNRALNRAYELKEYLATILGQATPEDAPALLDGIRLPGAGLIFSSGNRRKWTEPPGKLLHDEVVPAQICRHRGVGLCGCEGVGNEGRLAGRRTCAEHVAVESAHGRLAVPLSPRQLVGASSAATVGPGGSLAGRWVWRLPRRIPVPHGGARPRGSRRWRRRDEDTRRGPTPRTAASCLVAFPPLAAKPTGRGLGRRRDGAD